MLENKEQLSEKELEKVNGGFANIILNACPKCGKQKFNIVTNTCDACGYKAGSRSI